ncbi:MAG TPA: DNA cytosine methyltransferase [Bacteroidota bacterium]|nr:DNA cytosine methyltransferase [Bacteroidota bacterium]
MPSKSIKAIDFFCSIGGMTKGFRSAGVNVVAGIDIDPSCRETYEWNNPTSKFIEADIKKLSFRRLKKIADIKANDDKLVFIGCSPCQYWTIINTDKRKSKSSRNLLSDFQRFVVHFKPGFVVVENVPGIMKRKRASGLSSFIKSLTTMNYAVSYGVLNANHFGVPQNRRRFVLIASRIVMVTLPKGDPSKGPTTRDFIGTWNGFAKISAGHRDTTNFIHTTCHLSENNLKRIRLTKTNGGTREAWKKNESLQIKAYDKKDDSFKNVYGRMHWDKPAPTITTRFNSLSNGRFGHPVEDRALSLREGATLQTFPRNYAFKEKSINKIARFIGNAVPPKMAGKIGRSIKFALNK